MARGTKFQLRKNLAQEVIDGLKKQPFIQDVQFKQGALDTRLGLPRFVIKVDPGEEGKAREYIESLNSYSQEHGEINGNLSLAYYSPNSGTSNLDVATRLDAEASIREKALKTYLRSLGERANSH